MKELEEVLKKITLAAVTLLVVSYLWHWRGIWSIGFTQVAGQQVIACRYCPLGVGNIVVLRQPVKGLFQIEAIVFSPLPHPKPEKLLVADYLRESTSSLSAIPASDVHARVLYVFPSVNS